MTFIQRTLSAKTCIIRNQHHRRQPTARALIVMLFLGSSCIYPKLSPQPIKEEYLLTGPLEPTNRPYASGQDCRH